MLGWACTYLYNALQLLNRFRHAVAQQQTHSFSSQCALKTELLLHGEIHFDFCIEDFNRELSPRRKGGVSFKALMVFFYYYFCRSKSSTWKIQSAKSPREWYARADFGL